MTKVLELPDETKIKQTFSAVLGLPCWGSKRIIGSIVSFEFGQVAEPARPSPSALRRAIQTGLPTEGVRMLPPAGEWNFSLLNAVWEIQAEAVKADDESSSDKEIETALAIVNGQILTGVDWAAENGLILTFVRNTRISARPSPRHKPDSMMWWLLQNDGRQVSLDGRGMLEIEDPEMPQAPG